MSFYYEPEQRIIDTAEVKRIVYPSTIPRLPLKQSLMVYGIYWLRIDDRPDIGPLQRMDLQEPVKVADEYVRSWVVSDIFATDAEEDTYLQSVADEAERQAKHVEAEEDIHTDSVLSALRAMSKAQIENYIDNQVTDLPSAKNVIKKLAKATAYLLRKIDTQ